MVYQSDMAIASSMGQNGGILITDTTPITGRFKAILALEDTAFTTLTNNITKNGAETASTGADFGTLPAGFVIYGVFTAITLASGKAIAYK